MYAPKVRLMWMLWTLGFTASMYRLQLDAFASCDIMVFLAIGNLINVMIEFKYSFQSCVKVLWSGLASQLQMHLMILISLSSSYKSHACYHLYIVPVHPASLILVLASFNSCITWIEYKIVLHNMQLYIILCSKHYIITLAMDPFVHN